MRVWYGVGVVAFLAAIGAGWYVIAPPRKSPPPMPGVITGTTLYPSDFNPAQTVCAQAVSDPSWTKCVDVPEQVSAVVPVFRIAVPAGVYWVYAVITDPADLGLQESPKAYFTQFVTCGLRFDCNDHSKIGVTVGSGQTVTDIWPHDWYVH